MSRMTGLAILLVVALALGAQPSAARDHASAMTLQSFRLEPGGILFGLHPTEARIVVSAATAAPLKVCQLGTTFSHYWTGGCRRVSGRPIALPTSGGAVHVGFRVLPADGRATWVTALRVRWHCVDHYFSVLRGNTRVRASRPTFDC